MQSNTARKSESQDEDRRQLETALNNWREALLKYLQRESSIASQEARDAADGLAVAHRNPGQVDEDVIEILWSSLEKHSIVLSRLSRVSDRIQEMDLPELIVLFQRTEKLKTHPWEGEAWQLPEWIY